MYEQQIDRAIADMLGELTGHAVSNGNLANSATLRSFLRERLQIIARDVSARLTRQGLAGAVGIAMASNFLRRAAFDLFGPCQCATMLHARGEWSAWNSLTSVWQRGVGGALYGMGRSFVTNVVYTLPATVADRVDAQLGLVQRGHADAICDLFQHLHDDRALLLALFGAAGGVSSIELMGSDPHECGRRVAIVTFGNRVRVVYKPTRLTCQLLLMGTPESFRACAPRHAAIARLRSLFDTLRMGLPLLHIGAPTANAGHGYMEFKARAGPMTPSAAVNFYQAFGKLLAAACILGITDLHKENVMATDRGPFLIDAEMAFAFPNPGGPAQNVITHTGISDALVPNLPTHAIAGGGFSPYWSARHGWDASAISLPYGNDANSIVQSTRGETLRAAPARRDIYHGVRAGIDAMARNLVNAGRWIADFNRVDPYARLLLNTTNMVNLHMSGTTHYLNGTLINQATAVGGSFAGWMEWYGGAHDAVPAAFCRPRTRTQVFDPLLQPGVNWLTAAAYPASAATTVDLQNRLTAMLGSVRAVARTKDSLRLALVALFGGQSIPA